MENIIKPGIVAHTTKNAQKTIERFLNNFIAPELVKFGETQPHLTIMNAGNTIERQDFDRVRNKSLQFTAYPKSFAMFGINGALVLKLHCPDANERNKQWIEAGLENAFGYAFDPHITIITLWQKGLEGEEFRQTKEKIEELCNTLNKVSLAELWLNDPLQFEGEYTIDWLTKQSI